MLNHFTTERTEHRGRQSNRGHEKRRAEVGRVDLNTVGSGAKLQGDLAPPDWMMGPLEIIREIALQNLLPQRSGRSRQYSG